MKKSRYSVVDMLDDFVFGPLNLIENLIMPAVKMVWFRRWNLVTLTFDRSDKNENAENSAKGMIDHLKRNGIRIFSYRHDSQKIYVQISRKQEKWAIHLMGGSKHSNSATSPKTSWSDKFDKLFE